MNLSERKDFYTFLQRYIRFAEYIIINYRGDQPFHIYLKKYFALNRKHGSRDRKFIRSLTYDFFRIGHGARANVSREDQFQLGFFLCENGLDKNFHFDRDDIEIASPLEKKLQAVSTFFEPGRIFPFSEFLSSGIDVYRYNLSYLIQPALFLRIPAEGLTRVKAKLNAANIFWQKVSEDVLALANETNVENIFRIDHEVFIQDYNSALTAGYFQKYLSGLKGLVRVWDCCAGSGGKSLALLDKVRKVQLTVSDKRKSILHNLTKRFHAAGIKNFEAFVADLSLPLQKMTSDYDAIIADLPCTGSGTWARTPEMLHYFSKKEVGRYASLQKVIIQNALRHLRGGGFLFYITCSVFTEENEANVEFIKQLEGLHLLEMKYLKGYEMKADTLFVAIFQRQTL